MLQIFGALGVGIIISFAFSWQMTLLIFAFVPFMVAGGFLESHLISGQSSGNNGAFEDAGKVISSFKELMINMAMIFAL